MKCDLQLWHKYLHFYLTVLKRKRLVTVTQREKHDVLNIKKHSNSKYKKQSHKREKQFYYSSTQNTLTAETNSSHK